MLNVDRALDKVQQWMYKHFNSTPDSNPIPFSPNICQWTFRNEETKQHFVTQFTIEPTTLCIYSLTASAKEL